MQRLLAAARHERAKPAQAPAFPQTIQHTISKRLNFPGDLPPIWNMPHQRDPLLLGREQLLQELHTTLARDHHVLLFEPAREHEIDMSGASATAVEYAYRYQSDYQVIAWIQAHSHEALRSDLLSLANVLHLPQPNPADQDPLTAVVQWLRTHQHWLLVLDQVQEKEVLAPLMPLPEQGHLLMVTSTRSLESLTPLIELNQVPWEERTVLAQLSQVVGAALQGPQGRMPLGLEPITIGRASTNQIVLPDPSVSSRHAIIELKDQAYWITDTASTNGTLLNQQRLVPQVPSRLHPGDTIRLGNVTCTYEVLDQPSRSPVSSPSSEQGNASAGAYPPSSPAIERRRQDRVGQRFGNYRFVRMLGQGGFAEVYLGEHMHLGTPAAIKLLHTQLADEDIEFFRREARTIAHLVHPHIVRVFDFGIEGETPFLVMDYAPNGTLRKRHPKGVVLPLPTIQSYVKQIADALQYAHDEQFIHRDVKPENLLIGRRQEILLSDFGIALITQTSRSRSMQDVAGTASYMAPEQFQGKPRPASDQYALAVMVYEWLTGICPFHGSFTEIASQHLFEPPPPLKERIPAISPEIEQVVMTALAKDSRARFGSVQAFATAFEQASQAVQHIPSVQLNIAVSSPPATPAVPVPPPQSAPESSQTETEQVKPLLEQPEPLRGNGRAQEETPPRAPSDPPLHHTGEKEPAPSYEEVHVAPANGTSSHMGESASLDKTAAQDEKVKPWGIGKRQIIAMFIGIVIYSVVKLLFIQALIASSNPPFFNLSFSATIASGLTFVVLLFFATKFGPWIGLVIASLGWLFGDFLVSISYQRGFSSSPWYSYASIALLGFLSGLAFLRTRGRYNTREAITTAIVTSSIGIVVSGLLFLICESIVEPFNWITYFQLFALADTIALITLLILLIIYDRLERYNTPTA